MDQIGKQDLINFTFDTMIRHQHFSQLPIISCLKLSINSCFVYCMSIHAHEPTFCSIIPTAKKEDTIKISLYTMTLTTIVFKSS